MQKFTQKEITAITRITTSADNTKTFSITREIKGLKGEHAIFILFYPTRNTANCYMDDSTSTHLTKHMEEMKLNSYTIVNLFSTVTQSRLSMRGLEVDEENMTFLKEQIFSKLKDGKTKVVVAWGNSQQNSPVVYKSKQRILELWKETCPDTSLYQIEASGMKNQTSGTHPLFLGIRYSNAKWILKPYPLENALKIIKELQKTKQEKGKKVTK